MAAEVAPPRRGATEAWRTHPRLQRHLRRLLRSNFRAVLRRYDIRTASIGVESLMRYMCHVATWVALLPFPDATSVVDNEGLSPVRLLGRLLRRLSSCFRQEGEKSRSKRLTPWLHGILALVMQRLRGNVDVASEPAVKAEDASRQQWTDLWKSMPRSLRVQRMGLLPSPPPQPTAQECASSVSSSMSRDDARRRDCVEEPSSEISRIADGTQSRKDALPSLHDVALPPDSKEHRALLKLNKEIARWASRSCSERTRQLRRLDKLLVQAETSQDWRKLLLVLRQAAAALSAPRRRVDSTGAGYPMEFAASIAMMSQQRDVRRILLRALLALQGFEGDERVDRVVDHVWMTITNFAERAGKSAELVGELGAALSNQQWVRLARTVIAHRESSRQVEITSCVDDEQASSRMLERVGGEDRPLRDATQKGCASTEEGYIPSEKIQALPTIVHRPLE
eukprot:TRINITY_DN16397_c0_g1_i8.p1 TRINITY_DN16397_c0_g1~~TRINITY_DN16397_c0_g1_i8.p1  ORF type:complete len:500 (-),score=47.75 TRINITY_DN16397_c0_g1_i8:457-1815(-)